MLEGLEAAMRRLPSHHEAIPALRLKHAAVKAGFGGEQELDKVFGGYSFSMKHGIFHDLSLASSTYFQMDTLFITPWYAVLFEVKNIAGELTVTENPPQLIRTLDSGQVSGFKSPIAQLQSNCELFQDWLYSRDLSLPVYGAVVMAYASQRIEVFDTKTPVLFPSSVPSYIRKLPTTSPLLDDATFDHLLLLLSSGHRQFIPSPICGTYSIRRSDIRTGVICPECGFIGMGWNRRRWECMNCGFRCSEAHKQAIRDWFLLFGGKMMNKDCREFLHLERQQNANRMLRDMNLHTEGANRNRTYTIWISASQKKRT
ncbi:NERD domain-containing protein [Sporosarcina highlanderae]|uniref:NERD domain-containing protein n=1 Tax=Sporosarcina highlanderae TaxID=3035916 RepID=A0ABT8JP12_9BACL|nr:NERD domain-containing protein [Sporosarcina highlanderae]MDN4606152.1 NERD domain-containing protein [Sporosarcina highlanderae]